MTAGYTEVVTYWRGIVGTLVQRGLLRQRVDGQKVIPCATAVVEPERVSFVLDMQRLAGVAREDWLSRDLWAQWRAALQGHRCFVADSAGLAVVVAREPGERASRLPSEVVLSPDDVSEDDYTVFLGKSKAGPVMLDLAYGERAVLIGGTSGSGKTCTIRGLVLQMARKHGPDRLALAIVDLKALDFLALNGLPQLVRPVATTDDAAGELVAWCVEEMRRRQALMGAAGVTRWDRLHEDERFPLLLVVVDEVADFGGGPVMGDLVELARKGRASGVSLILATQRPDAEVLSRQVKANVPVRLSFRCTDQVESRIILDRGGAEQIRQVGRCITNAGGVWRTVQAAHVPDDALGEWIEIAPRRPALTNVEAALVRYADTKLGGAFTVNSLADAFRGTISRRQLLKLAQRWELRGWLTAPASATEPRLVTPALRELIGCALDRESGTAIPPVPRGTARSYGDLPPFLEGVRTG